MKPKISFRLPALPDRDELIAQGRREMAESPYPEDVFLSIFDVIRAGRLTYLHDNASGLDVWLEILPDGRLSRTPTSEADMQWMLRAIPAWGGTDISIEGPDSGVVQ